MNMFKSNGGFTLVELIVVIAILAILAGIAVPSYSGYIKKAEQAADLQFLSTVNTAVQGLAAAEEATITTYTVTSSGISDLPTEVTMDEICELLGGTTWADVAPDDIDYEATWSNGEWDIDYAE